MSINPNINDAYAKIQQQQDEDTSSNATKTSKNKKKFERQTQNIDRRKIESRLSVETKKTETDQETVEKGTLEKGTFQDTLKRTENQNKSTPLPSSSGSPSLPSPNKSLSSATREKDSTFQSLSNFINTTLKETPQSTQSKQEMEAFDTLNAMRSAVQESDPSKKSFSTKETEQQAASTLSKKLGISENDAQTLLSQVSLKLKRNGDVEASIFQKSAFHDLIKDTSPEKQKTLSFLYANPEFKSAASKEIQIEFQTAFDRADEMTRSEFPNNLPSQETGHLEAKRPLVLEEKFMELISDQNLPQEDKNILTTLFSRPETASAKSVKQQILLQTRNEFIAKAMKEILKDNSGIDIKSEDLASIMKDANTLSKEFSKNIKHINLDEQAEREALDLLTLPKKNANPEAEQAHDQAMQQSLKGEAFQKYPSGFSKNTLREAEGFQTAMENGIANLNVPESIKKQLLDLVMNPEKLQIDPPAPEVAKLFYELVANEGFLGMGQVHSTSTASIRAVGDHVAFLSKLKAQLKKSGASKAQADKFIEKLLNGEISMNHPIIRKSLSESLTERGLPEDYTFDLESLKKTHAFSKTEVGLKAMGIRQLSEDYADIFGELQRELSSQQTSETEDPSFNFEISVGQFVFLIQEVSTKMMATSQEIAYSDSKIATEVQNALRISNNLMLQAQQAMTDAQKKLGKIGQGIRDVLVFALMITTNPIGTVHQIIAAGGFGNKNVIGVVESSQMHDVVDFVFDKVLQPIMKIIGKLLEAAKDIVKLALIWILSPILMPGFIENIQDEGFKDAIDESLLTNFNATLEAYGITNPDVVAALDTVFTVVMDAAAIIALTTAAIAATIVTGGGALVIIGMAGIAISMASMLIGQSLMQLMPEWEESGWISNEQEKNLKIAIGVIMIVGALTGMVMGLGAGITRATKIGAKTIAKIDKAILEATALAKQRLTKTLRISSNAAEVVDQLGATVKPMSISEEYISKRAMKLNQELDRMVELTENLGEKLEDDHARILKQSIDNLKELQLQLPLNGPVDDISELSAQAKTSLKKIEEIANNDLKDFEIADLEAADRKLSSLSKAAEEKPKVSEAPTSNIDEAPSAKTDATSSTDPVSDPDSQPTDPTEPADPTEPTDPTDPSNQPDGAGAPAPHNSLDGTSNLTQSNLTASEDALNEIRDNVKKARKRALQRLQREGEHALQETAKMEEYIAPKVKRAKRKRAWARRIHNTALQAITLGKIVGGSQQAYEGLLEILKSIPEAKIEKEKNVMSFYSDNADISQQTISALFTDAKNAQEDVQDSYKFYMEVITKLSMAVNAISKTNNPLSR